MAHRFHLHHGGQIAFGKMKLAVQLATHGGTPAPWACREVVASVVALNNLVGSRKHGRYNMADCVKPFGSDAAGVGKHRLAAGIPHGHDLQVASKARCKRRRRVVRPAKCQCQVVFGIEYEKFFHLCRFFCVIAIVLQR